MNKILLVEDAVEFQRLVETTLAAGFAVTTVATAADAQKHLDESQVDLIILDVMLPDDDGFRFCANLQNHEKTRDIPVIFLSGKSEVNDRVMGYSLGAEDYITKPFSPVELRARVEARLRKLRSKQEKQEVFRKGDLKFNIPFQKVFIVNGTRESGVELTPIEFKLLLFLAQREEQVFSREQLMGAIWTGGVHIVDRTVDVHVSNIRKKLGRSSCTIRSVRSVGYSFVQKMVS
jgi:DNA-binding response OmpR family regulator